MLGVEVANRAGRSYWAVPALHNKGKGTIWSKCNSLRYRTGPARHDKIGTALAQSDSTIIFINHVL